jgi:uncharacterized cupredoxin-like copper-binding protein
MTHVKLILPALAFAAAAAAPRPKAEPARTLAITATNYAFDMPDTVAAGRTVINLLNKGPELHHAQIVRLEGGHTLAEAMQTPPGGPPPSWIREIGGPNTPVPGGTSTAVVDLKPGNYAVLCFIPGPDGKPHIMKGMVRAFTVVQAPNARLASDRPGSGAPAAVAAPDVTIQLSDYAFAISRPITAGKHVIRVSNGAKQAHEIFIARLAPGKSASDLLAWSEKQEGPPPGMPLGGTVGLATGESNDVVVDLAPGTYALLCFIPDAKDGKEHLTHGMAKQMTVS